MTSRKVTISTDISPALEIERRGTIDMTIDPLLVEQRRIADEFRIVEEAVQQMHRTLTDGRLDAATRWEIEACAISTTTELIRLGRKRLELDASVSAANERAKLKSPA